jgi:intein/homing endonuclease
MGWQRKEQGLEQRRIHQKRNLGDDMMDDTINKEIYRDYYYRQNYTIFELAKLAQYREMVFIDKEKKKLPVRCMFPYKSEHIREYINQFKLVPNWGYNIYFSVAQFQNAPMFSYNPKERRAEMDRWSGVGCEPQYKKHLKGFDLFFDFDSANPDDIKDAYLDALKMKASLDKYQVPYYFGFSVVGDTPILIKENGKIYLERIDKIVEKLKKGSQLECLSLDEDKKVTFQKIYNYLQHDDMVYEVFFKNSSRPISITKHHSVYILDDWLNIKTKRLEELSEGDNLISFFDVQNKQDLKKSFVMEYTKFRIKKKTQIPLTKELLIFCGHFLGNGHLSKQKNSYGITITCCAKKEEQIKEVVDCIKKIQDTHICFQKPNEGSIQLTINSVPLHKFLLENFATGAKNKSLPSFVWDLSTEQVKNLLQGYCNSDGHKDEYNIVIKSVSRKLIVEFIWLLKLNGIHCILQDEYNKPHKMPQGTIFKGSYVYILSLNNTLLGLRDKNKFSPAPRSFLFPTTALKYIYKQCKPSKFIKNRNNNAVFKKKYASPDRILNVLEWFKTTKTIEFDEVSLDIIKKYERIINSKLMFNPITKIIKKNMEKVYDISVEHSENFFGGEYPVLLHNSGSKGFHIRLPFKVLPQTLGWDIVEFCKRVGEMCYERMKLNTLDLGVFDDRRVYKAPYSFDRGNICLPLDDEQVENFQITKMKAVYVLNHIKIYNRGDLMRHNGLGTETERNHFLEWFKELKK